MNKELEALKRVKYNSSKEVVDAFDIIENALIRLESIDNTSPSEAIKCLDELDNCLISDMSVEIDDYDESNYCMSYEYIDFNGEGLQFNDDIKEEKMIDFIREKKISSIKQALLKAQEQDFNYNKIVIPFFDELVKILGITDTDEMLNKIKEQEKVLNIIKKHITHIPNYYNSQADYSLESFGFNIKEDNKWLSGEEREQYKQDFKLIKEVFEK